MTLIYFQTEAGIMSGEIKEECEGTIIHDKWIITGKNYRILMKFSGRDLTKCHCIKINQIIGIIRDKSNLRRAKNCLYILTGFLVCLKLIFKILANNIKKYSENLENLIDLFFILFYQ